MLAKRISLTKATISALITDLLERGLVEDLGPTAERRRGRPAAAVTAAGRSVGALGLEIGVDRVAACVVDLDGEVRARRVQHGENRRSRPERVFDRLATVAQRAAEDAAAAGIRCVGGALAVPGLDDPSSRALFIAPNMRWLDIDLTLLDDILAFVVGVDNDAGNVAVVRGDLDREGRPANGDGAGATGAAAMNFGICDLRCLLSRHGTPVEPDASTSRWHEHSH